MWGDESDRDGLAEGASVEAARRAEAVGITRLVDAEACAKFGQRGGQAGEVGWVAGRRDVDVLRATFPAATL